MNQYTKLIGDCSKHDLLFDIYSFALSTSMCRALRESGALVRLLGSHNCVRVTHFTSAFICIRILNFTVIIVHIWMTALYNVLTMKASVSVYIQDCRTEFNRSYI